MSFQKSTHQKALDALERDDVARLKTLIYHPVHSTHKRAQGYLLDLVQVASGRGQTEAVRHLVSMANSPPLQISLLQNAWARAVVGRHPDTQQWAQEQLFTVHGQQFKDLYTFACRTRTWDAALHLFDQGFPLSHKAASEALWLLYADVGHQNRLPEQEVLMRRMAERLMPYFVPEQVANSAYVAMRLKMDDWVTRLLADVTAKAEGCAEAARTLKQSNHLHQEAVDQERLDWLLAIQAAQQSPVFWVQQIKWAVARGATLEFVDRMWSEVAEVRQQLSTTPTSASEILSWILARHDTVQPNVRATVIHLMGDLDPDLAREDMIERYRAHLPNQVMGNDEMDKRLNRLFLCVPPEVQTRWHAEDGVLFGPGMARVREEQARESCAPTRRRDRFRA